MEWKMSMMAAVVLATAQPPADKSEPTSEIPAPAPTAPAVKTPTPPPPLTPELDNLLTRLEGADKELRTLKATVKYIKTFSKTLSEIQGDDQHTWEGTLWFSSTPPPPAAGTAPAKAGDRPKRAFAVKFDSLIVDNKRRDESKEYVFDGSWLLERNSKDKQFSRREVVAPGSNTDPMRIGEGPLPIPIGQRKADMLERFDIELVDALDGVPTEPEFKDLREKLLNETYQLRLRPKAGSRQAKDFRDIRMWYRKSDLMPVRAQTVNTDESKAEVLLLRIEKNPDIHPATFRTDAPPRGEGWNGEEVPFRQGKGG